MTKVIEVRGWPKSGNHYTRSLLEEAGFKVIHSHSPGWADVHVIRDPRDVAVSWIYHFKTGKDAPLEEVRKYVETAVNKMTCPDTGELRTWGRYVTAMKQLARHQVSYAYLVDHPAQFLQRVGVSPESARMAAEKLSNKVSYASEEHAWEKWKFRRGRPGDHKRVMTPEQIEFANAAFAPYLRNAGFSCL